MFKDGDLVQPTPAGLARFRSNNFGDCIGIVCNEGRVDDRYKYRVKWDGGNIYWYNSEHIELLSFTLENE